MCTLISSHDKRIWPKAPALFAFALVVTLAAPHARADQIIDLGTAGGYAVVGLSNSSLTTGTTINLSLVTVNGAIASDSHGTVNNMAPSVINGNVYLDPTSKYSGPGTLNGSVFTQSMSQVNADALAASVKYAGLAPDQTFSSITSATTIQATHTGLNVIKVNGDINLNNANLTLSDNGFGSNVGFVLDITGTLTTTGTARLTETSNVAISNILYNFVGTSGQTITSHVGDTQDGIFLAPSYNFNLDGTWNGELLGGPLTIGLFSNSTINGVSPPAVPEPSSAALACSALILGGFGWLKRGWSRRIKA